MEITPIPENQIRKDQRVMETGFIKRTCGLGAKAGYAQVLPT